MFTKEEGKVVEEFKLRVVYISAKPPFPVSISTGLCLHK
ncbi:unnamed protein product [Rhodiola kirilowii]